MALLAYIRSMSSHNCTAKSILWNYTNLKVEMQYFLKSFLSTLLLVTYIARWSAAYDAAGSSRKLSRLVRRPPFAVIRNPCESGQQSVSAVHSTRINIFLFAISVSV